MNNAATADRCRGHRPVQELNGGPVGEKKGWPVEPSWQRAKPALRRPRVTLVAKVHLTNGRLRHRDPVST